MFKYLLYRELSNHVDMKWANLLRNIVFNLLQVLIEQLIQVAFI